MVTSLQHQAEPLDRSEVKQLIPEVLPLSCHAAGLSRVHSSEAPHVGELALGRLSHVHFSEAPHARELVLGRLFCSSPALNESSSARD